MTPPLDDVALVRVAHQFLRASVSADPADRDEDPSRPETVQAMQIALEIPKQDPPERTDLLEAAARAVVAVCLDPRAGQDGPWHDGLAAWYGHRIRKVARRARNKAWRDVQALPGVTVTQNGASARAFVPSAVSEVPHAVSKLQIRGTDLEADEPGEVPEGAALILVDEALAMSTGKDAAQVGHASMLLAAAMETDAALAWAEAGFPLAVREVPAAEFARAAARADAVVVRDAGFTEVAPGSATAVALPPRR